MKRNTTKLLSTLLALCLVLAALPGTAQAETVTYAVEGGYFYFDTATGTITACDKSITKASIPNIINGVTVTGIGKTAFVSCSNLTNVTIPDSVTTIGEDAFYGCQNLTSVSIPNSVTCIGKGAFSLCYHLTSVSIPDSVTTIGDYVFDGCNLSSVTIPDSVITIGECAFSSCLSLTSITIPDSVTTIGDWAFGNCYCLSSVSIPNSVTTIGAGAFSQCPNLTSITIPDSVTTIREGAFGDCKNLTSINVSSGNFNYTSVDGVLFDKGQTLLHTYPVGKSTKPYSIPNSVTTIGDLAFYGCNLSSVTIPNSVTAIGEEAFGDCSSLTSITIPDSVTTIGTAAYMGCDSLTDIYYGGSQADWEKIDPSLPAGYDLPVTIHYNSTTPQQPSGTPTNSVNVTVKGATVQWPDATPFIDEHGRTMVPLRAVAGAMGLTVNWDANAREASFTNGSKTIIFPIGSNAARTSNGISVQMNTAAVIVNGRTYAPIRYLAEFFNYHVDWDAANHTVIITEGAA